MQDLLERNNYVVRIRKTRDGCHVTFPDTKIINPDMPSGISFEYRPLYGVGKKDAKLTVVKISEGAEKAYTQDVPNYAVRNYISLDILTAVRQLSLSSQIFVYYDESGEKVDGLSDVLPGVEEAKESSLTELYVNGQAEGFPKYVKAAKKAKVYPGYRLLTEAFP